MSPQGSATEVRLVGLSKRYGRTEVLRELTPELLTW
jgi:hypothetical protein